MNIQLTISIVSYNNPKLLFPCLDSIAKFHNIDNYEIIVVAYMFSSENLLLLKNNYPKVSIIESNEIRGYAENNNLALKSSRGNSCLILNDDIEFIDNSIDKMLQTLNQNDNVSIVSPIIEWQNIEMIGNEEFTLWKWIFDELRLARIFPKRTSHLKKETLYKSYNILGSCFMIRTEILKELGYFNEYYFFAPEDIELSTKANKAGYSCYVNTTTKIIHLHGATSKPIYYAIEPAVKQGIYYFYRTNSNFLVELLARFFSLFLSIGRILLFLLKGNKTLFLASCYRFIYCFLDYPPKEIFISIAKRHKLI